MASLADYAPDDRTARVMLSIVAEPGDARVGRLLNRVGGVETIRLLDTDTAMPELRREDAEVLRHRVRLASDGADFDELMPRLLDGRYTPLISGDLDWPAGLVDLGERAPYVLWAEGATSLLSRPVSDLVTITGSRASTSYGDLVAGEIAAGLAEEDKVIVAGGAYGIEAAAHRAALSTGGSTIAVLAGGIDRNYPRGNTELLDTIRAVGAVVSEQPPGAAPTRSRFLARSRVLAALSAATIVPEAGARSGALVTTEHALRLGRGVGAVPGPVTSAASTGPHMLIQDRHATLVTSALDAQALMDRPGSPQSRPAGRTATGSSLDLEQARAERDEPGRRL